MFGPRPANKYYKTMAGKERAVYLAIIGLLVAGTLYFAFKTDTALSPSSSPPAYDADSERHSWPIEEFITNLEVPWDMAEDSAGNFYLTERPGRVRSYTSEAKERFSVALKQVASVGESGLTGLALHPNFDENGHLYLYYSYRQSGQLYNRVSRFRLSGEELVEETYILDRLPGGSIHNGERLRFGPDGMLWVLTGDAARASLAQDPTTLAGKVLRLTENGQVPPDNPTPGWLVYSLGHRNPQGLAWHPLTEELLVTEHGETAHDEINIIKPLANYGWPRVKKCYSEDKSLAEPILCSGEETFALSGIAASGTAIWRLRNSFFFAGLRGNLLERIELR